VLGAMRASLLVQNGGGTFGFSDVTKLLVSHRPASER
jgi:hypothetical protein